MNIDDPLEVTPSDRAFVAELQRQYVECTPILPTLRARKRAIQETRAEWLALKQPR